MYFRQSLAHLSKCEHTAWFYKLIDLLNFNAACFISTSQQNQIFIQMTYY